MSVALKQLEQLADELGLITFEDENWCGGFVGHVRESAELNGKEGLVARNAELSQKIAIGNLLRAEIANCLAEFLTG